MDPDLEKDNPLVSDLKEVLAWIAEDEDAEDTGGMHQAYDGGPDDHIGGPGCDCCG